MPVGTITALRAQDDNPQRVEVFIDGAFAIAVSLSTLAREGLFVGLQLDAPAWANLEAAESVERAVQLALRALEQRPRTAAEIHSRLVQRGFLPAVADATIAQLRSAGLIDDTAFAQRWIESRTRTRPRGAQAIRAELQRRGVARDTAAEAIAAALDPQSEAANAEAAARAVLRRYANAPDRATFYRKLGGHLQRRGFRFDTIGPLLERLWRELRANPTDTDDEHLADDLQP